jgi:hypothetical protein
VTKARRKSYSDHFWAFVQQNPELATAIAFEVGAVAGTFTAGTSLKRVSRLPTKVAHAVPKLAHAALKYLPEPSPSLQPGAGKTRKGGKSRKARKGNGTKSS